MSPDATFALQVRGLTSHRTGVDLPNPNGWEMAARPNCREATKLGNQTRENSALFLYFERMITKGLARKQFSQVQFFSPSASKQAQEYAQPNLAQAYFCSFSSATLVATFNVKKPFVFLM